MSQQFSRCNVWRGGLALIVALPGAATWAQAPGRAILTSAERSVAAAEDSYLRAQLHHDIAALDRIWAAEGVLVHATGRTQTRAEYFDGMRARPIPYHGGSIENRVVRVFGDVGVTRGTLRLQVNTMQLDGLYLAVWVKRGGGWRLLDWQTSPAPRPDETGPTPSGRPLSPRADLPTGPPPR